MMFGGFFQFEILFFVMFFLIAGTIIVMLCRGIGEWYRNNRAPRLTVSATVISRRIHVSHEHRGDPSIHGHHDHTLTTYYVTFQVESGDRMEFPVSGDQYGILLEGGDRGKLFFQGTRYLAFERT